MTENARLQPSGRYRSLDAIRGVAAFIVLLAHCFGAQPNIEALAAFWHKYPLLLFFINGRGAVTIFFVLSGFVLALPQAAGRALPYRDFVIRRLCRIYIPFAAALVFGGALFLLTDHTVSGEGYWVDQIWGERELTPVNIAGHFLMTGVSDQIFIDAPMWSLVHEMRASLVFPVLVLLCARQWRGVAAIAAIFGTAVWAINTHGGFMDFPVMTDSFMMTLAATLFFLPAFMTGILLALNHDAVVRLLRKAGPFWQGALWIAALAIFIVFGSFFHTPLLVLAAGLTIALTITSGRAAAILEWRGFQWLGHISYSLYLVHLPILFALVKWLRHDMGYISICLLAIAGSLVTADLMRRFVETPSISLGKSLTRHKAGT